MVRVARTTRLFSPPTVALATLVLAPLAASCGGDPPPGPASATAPLASERAPVLAEADDRAGASRGELEGAGVEEPVPTGAVATSEAATTTTMAAARPLVRLTALRDVPAEDGAGGQAPASHATAIDLDAQRFPARARDPILRVGSLVLRRYEHPRPGVLRFVLADAAAPPDGAAMSAEYEGDADSRVSLGTFDRSAIATEAP